jgi:hypothetical protein
MKIPTISEVASMDDAGMSSFLGQDQELARFREEVGKLNALTGKARKEADKMWEDRFKPHVSADSLKWMHEDAVRSTKTGKELLEDTSPASVF